MKEFCLTLGVCLTMLSIILNANTNTPDAVLLCISLTGLFLCIFGYVGMKRARQTDEE